MKVPRQNNGSDCGVFVCRYAFAMFQLRHLKFTYQDAGLDRMSARQSFTPRQRDVLRPKAFLNLITNGKAFEFDVDDIQRIRSEFKTLIRNLHPLYQVVRDERMKAEKEEKNSIIHSFNRNFALEVVWTEASGRMRDVIEDPDCMFHSKAPERRI